VLGVHVDLPQDRFDVTYDPERVSPAQLLEAVTRLGYRPELVPTPADRGGEASAARVDLARLPEDLRLRFEQATAADKLVLLRFSGAN
jgi:hypothetical protein